MENSDVTSPVLSVEGLTTCFATRAGTVTAVDNVSLAVHRGEVLGLVGESGSGKSMTGYSILGLVDPPGRIVSGAVKLSGQDLRALTPGQLRTIRGDRIAMIFQDPMMTLNPVLRIDTQMIETVLAHRDVSHAAAYARSLDVLKRVGIPSPEERLRSYPHQFSGGMRQRVAIAIALLNAPDLIICDEPTTALDVTIQGQILYEMQKLCRESGTALIWITHDLSVVAGLADRVAVMYAGRIVETGTVSDVLEHPRHPYTAGLIASTPAAAVLRHSAHGEPLMQIPGMAPSLLNPAPGCRFRPRCDRASEACAIEPALAGAPGMHQYRCIHPLASDALAEELA